MAVPNRIIFFFIIHILSLKDTSYYNKKRSVKPLWFRTPFSLKRLGYHKRNDNDKNKIFDILIFKKFP